MSLLRFVILAGVVELLGLALWGRLVFHPDLLLAMVVVRSLTRRPPEGAVAGLLAGLFRDGLYGQTLGVTALPFAAVGVVVGALGRTLYRESVVTQAVLIFLLGLRYGARGFLLASGGSV